jgi:hypothetical protein
MGLSSIDVPHLAIGGLADFHSLFDQNTVFANSDQDRGMLHPVTLNLPGGGSVAGMFAQPDAVRTLVRGNSGANVFDWQEAVLGRWRLMSAGPPENYILDIAAGLACSIAIARTIVSSEPAAVVALVTAARKAAGNDVEKNTHGSLTALRASALEQVKLADAALEIFETCGVLANSAALATIGPSDDHGQFRSAK